MSLVTLTFGNSANRMANAGPHAMVSTPEARMRQKSMRDGATGTAIVRRACRFYGQDDVYLVAEVTDGFLSEGMKMTFNGAPVELASVESKYGRSAKKGMTVGLIVKGISEAEFENGSELSFVR